jgi:hypothetical protein
VTELFVIHKLLKNTSNSSYRPLQGGFLLRNEMAKTAFFAIFKFYVNH